MTPNPRTARRACRSARALVVAGVAIVATLAALTAGAAPGGALPSTAAPALGAANGVDPFTPVNPTRVMDTRENLGGPRLGAGETRRLAAGAGMPVGAVAVALNVTVVGASGVGYLTFWEAAAAQPPTSSLNFVAGETRATAVVAAVDGTGQVDVFNAAGTVDVIVDVTGWFVAGFTPVAPARLLDTRDTTAIAGGETRDLVVAGAGGVPGSGAIAAAFTVTVTNPEAAGYLTAWPAGAPVPPTSTVNFAPGQTVASTVLVGLGTGGAISLAVAGGRTDVIVDVIGWFSAGYDALAQPARLLDTRDGTGSCGLFLDREETRTITVAGAGGVPGTGVGGAALNLTVTVATGGAGVLTVWPTGQPQPLASNLNYVPGQTVSNTVLVGLGSAGQVSIANAGGTIELIVDVNGSFPGLTQGGTPLPCPSLTTPSALPVAGRFLPDGTIATGPFNAIVAGLGGVPVTQSPVAMALALTGTTNALSTRVAAVTGAEAQSTTTVTVDADRLGDDSVAGIHSVVRLQRLEDGTYRVTSATWGYNCHRRPSPPFLPELCP